LNLTKQFFYMPEAASQHGPQIDQMIDYVHWLMLVLFIGWGAFFIYTLFRFRAGRNARANYEGVKSHTSTYLEIGVAAAEAVLLIGFSIPLWAERVDEVPPAGESVVVRVVGEQFVWNVHYPGKDGVFGRSSTELIDLETNPLGLDRADPAAADDITTINQLHLPVDKAAVLHLSSKDVIHSFSLPHMRVKQDTVPGLSIPLWFVPTITTADMRQRLGDDDFQYEITCAQLCGLGHYRMRGFLTVHEQAGFDAWIDEQTELLAEAGTDDFWD
jgi:cytochrome c oxidase subunit 2